MEFGISYFFMHQPPFVPSVNKLRKAAVEYIVEFYPNAKNIVEIGSGYGGFAREVAKNTNANVIGIENMPMAALVSFCADLFSKTKSKTVWCDAFDYLDKTDICFDVGLAYLGPDLTPELKKFSKKIKVLISLDFEIPELNPVKVIDLKCGYTIYNRVRYPHKLFIYEFKK